MARRTTDEEFLALVVAKVAWCEARDAGEVGLHFADVERLVELAKKGLKSKKSKRSTRRITRQSA